MEPVLVLAGAGVLLSSVLISASVERIIHRLNARPAEPEERSRGIGDVATLLARWRRSRDSR